MTDAYRYTIHIAASRERAALGDIGPAAVMRAPIYFEVTYSAEHDPGATVIFDLVGDHYRVRDDVPLPFLVAFMFANDVLGEVENPNPRRPAFADEESWTLAVIYVQSRLRNAPTIDEIAAYFRITKAAAAKRIQRARETGYLAPNGKKEAVL